MTSSAPEPRASRAGLETVHKGQEFPPTPLDLTRQTVGKLLDSLEASLPQREDGVALVPPSVMASLSLGALLRHVALPDGALHASQEINVEEPVAVGAHAVCQSVVSAVSDRAGMTFVTLDFRIESGDSDARTLATGSGTVMFPASAKAG